MKGERVSNSHLTYAAPEEEGTVAGSLYRGKLGRGERQFAQCAQI